MPSPLATIALLLALLAAPIVGAQTITLPPPMTAPTPPATVPSTQIISGGGGIPAAPSGKPLTTATQAGKSIDYLNNGVPIKAYLVAPEGPGPFPAIIVAHDIFGLNPWIKKQADQLATQGYVVIVPDLNTRQNLAEPLADARTAWLAYDKMSDQQALSDLRAAVNFLVTHPTVGDKQPLAIVGYDMGGIYAMMLASIDLRIKAAVNYYGQIIYPVQNKLRPISPVEILFNLRAPLLSFYGDIDPQNPPDHLARLQSRLEHNPNNTHFTIITYPNVGHGFLVESRLGYNAQATQDAQDKTRDFLAKFLRVKPVTAKAGD